MGFPYREGADPAGGVELEPIDQADPRIAAPAQPPPQQLTAEDAAQLATIQGLDPAKVQALQQQVNARQPAANVGGAQVLDPLQQEPAPAAPQYSIRTIPVESSSTSSTSGYDQRTIKNIQDAAAAVTEAQKKGVEAAQPQIERNAKETAEVAHLADQRAKQTAAAAIEGADLRDRNIAAAKDYRTKLDADISDFTKQGDTVDSNRVWHRMDTTQKVGYAIAAALAGFGEALQGRGGNPVLDMLTQAEDRDLRAQEMGLQAKGKGIQMRESMYSRLVEAGHSEEVARAATTVEANQVIADQIAAAAANAQNAPAAERMQVLQAQMAEKQAMDRETLAKATARSVTSSTTTRKQAVTVDENGVPVQKGSEQDNRNFLQDVQRMVKGGSIKIADPQALKDAFNQKRITPRVYEQLQAAERLSGIRKAVTKTVDSYYDSDINSADADKAQATMRGLAADIKGQAALAKGSALTPEEGRHIDDTLPVLERSVGSPSTSGWKSAREKDHARATGAIDALVTPVEGNLAPFGLSIGSGADLGQPSKQVRYDGKVYTLYADGSVVRQ